MAESMNAESSGSEPVDPLTDTDALTDERREAEAHRCQRRVLVLVGAGLAAATLVAAVWMAASTGPSSTVPNHKPLDARAPGSRAADLFPKHELAAPSASIAGTAPDVAVTPLDRALIADTTDPKAAAAEDALRASADEGAVGNDENPVVHALADMADTLQAIQERLDVVLADMRNRPTAMQPASSAATDATTAQLRQQLQRRDSELAALRRERAAREQTITSLTEQLQRVEGRPALPGWTVVGLTAQSAALRDPSGRTRVVAAGEVIVDDIKVISIDTASNRVHTTVGDMIHRGGTP